MDQFENHSIMELKEKYSKENKNKNGKAASWFYQTMALFLGKDVERCKLCNRRARQPKWEFLEKMSVKEVERRVICISAQGFLPLCN